MVFTPQELSAIIFHTVKSEDEKIKLEWELTRISTYFLISVQLQKKNRISYSKFKSEIWPFMWERKRKKSEKTSEGLMSFEQWKTLLSKPLVSSKEFPLNGSDKN